MKMHQRWGIAALLSSHLLSLAGGVLTIAGIVSLLVSTSVRSWVSSHSGLVFDALIVVSLIAFVLADYVAKTAREASSSHDRETVSKFLGIMSPDSVMTIWLKETIHS